MLSVVGGVNAGLGRLKKIDSENAELGGIYVLPEYRKLGIASKIIAELISIGAIFPKIYRLPYSHLGNFYGSFGFTIQDNSEKIPDVITKKHNWCKSTYEENVLLMGK